MNEFNESIVQQEMHHMNTKEQNNAPNSELLKNEPNNEGKINAPSNELLKDESNKEQINLSVKDESNKEQINLSVKDESNKEQINLSVKDLSVKDEQKIPISPRSDNELKSFSLQKDIGIEGSDMTRDIHVALMKEKQNRPFSYSMPECELMLYEDVGKASDIATPGGFRRAHIRSRLEDDTNDSIAFTPLMEKIQTHSKEGIEGLYDDFVFAQFEVGMSMEDYPDDGMRTPLIRQISRGHRGYGPSGDGDMVRPLEERGASVKKTVFTILKSFIGSGILFLPKGFQNGGMLFSSIILFLSAAISTFCMLRLTDCALSVKSKNSVSYGNLGELAYGKIGKIAVDISLVLSQLGFCCSYVIFNAKNVRDVIVHATNCEVIPSMELLIFLQLPLITPLTWVRKLKYFSISNLVADVFIFIGLAYILGYSVDHMITTTEEPTWHNFNSDNWGLFLGTAVYVFEGIGLIIPIHDAMDPSVRDKFSQILSKTIFYLVVFFTAFSGIVYASFGEKTQAVVTLNLPNKGVQIGTISVQLLYCIALLLTYPLMMYPAVTILEGYAIRASAIKGAHRWRKNAFRCVLVGVTLVVSYAGSEELDNFVALIGGFCSVPLAFIYPCMFHTRLVGKGVLVNYCISIVGVLVMIFATSQALSTWGPKKVNDICVKVD